MDIKEIIQKYKTAEKDRTFPFSEWHRRDVFEKLIQPFLVDMGYNPDKINYDDPRGVVEIEIRKNLKITLPIISLVDAILQKKKEYHSISQSIEDYVDFKDAELIRLDEFLTRSTEDFEVLSSLKVKYDNFDALRVRVGGDEFILEYGVRRKIEEYEEIDEEDEQTEISGKYIIEWKEAGKGKIEDIEAYEFLADVLKGIKKFSKARKKSIWQKIAEVKIPEFNEKARKGFLEYKSAIEKARKLDEEITEIDRAIDRLVYELYGLIEEEIKVVEESVWGDKFEEMYGKLPLKEEALGLSKEVEEWN